MFLTWGLGLFNCVSRAFSSLCPTWWTEVFDVSQDAHFLVDFYFFFKAGRWQISLKYSPSKLQEHILQHLTQEQPLFCFKIKLWSYQATREQYHSPCFMFCQSARVEFNSQTAQVGFLGYGSFGNVVYLVYRTELGPSHFRTFYPSKTISVVYHLLFLHFSNWNVLFLKAFYYVLSYQIK